MNELYVGQKVIIANIKYNLRYLKNKDKISVENTKQGIIKSVGRMYITVLVGSHLKKYSKKDYKEIEKYQGNSNNKMYLNINDVKKDWESYYNKEV